MSGTSIWPDERSCDPYPHVLSPRRILTIEIPTGRRYLPGRDRTYVSSNPAGAINNEPRPRMYTVVQATPSSGLRRTSAKIVMLTLLMVMATSATVRKIWPSRAEGSHHLRLILTEQMIKTGNHTSVIGTTASSLRVRVLSGAPRAKQHESHDTPSRMPYVRRDIRLSHAEDRIELTQSLQTSLSNRTCRHHSRPTARHGCPFLEILRHRMCSAMSKPHVVHIVS